MLPAGIILAVVVLESVAAARTSRDMEPAVTPLLRVLLIAAAAAALILFGARVLADRALEPAFAAAMWPSLLVVSSALALWLKGICRKRDLVVMPSGGGRRRSRGRRSAHASLLTCYRICLFCCLALAVMSAYSTSSPRPQYVRAGPDESPPPPAITPTPVAPPVAAPVAPPVKPPVIAVAPEPVPAAPPPDPAIAANPNPFVPPMVKPEPAPEPGSPSPPPAAATPPLAGPVKPEPAAPAGGPPVTPAPEPPEPATPAPPTKTSAPPPDEALMAKFKRARVLVRPVTPGSNLLEIDYSLAGLTEGKLHLELLAGFKDQLQTLDLSRTPIKDDELSHLVPLTKLTVLYLSRTGITDAGVEHLAGLTSLEYLNLYGTEITDAGLKGLQPLANLRKLYLWKSKATPEGVAVLQKHLPKCQINMGQ